MASIIWAENNNWYPEYEGCNFHDVYTEKAQDQDYDFAYFKDDDGYTFQINEENGIYYQNDTIEDMNACALVDPRDDKAWWWFPDSRPWEYVSEAIGIHGTYIHTVIPRPEVVKNFMRIYGKLGEDERP